VFQNILEKARQGKCPRSTWDALVARMGCPLPAGIIPTVIFATRRDADDVNASSYAELKATGAAEMIYKTVYGGRRIETTRNWAKCVEIPETIALCIGAQVMLTANLDVEGGLVNGTRGTVVRLMRDSVEMRLVSGHLATIPAKKHMDDTEHMHATYIPLRLGYAITAHRSQGVTLDCAAVDLGPSIFAYGQAYTALSRVRDISSIHIIDLAKASFKVDPDVKEFYGWNQKKAD
jgi:ATP-dependent DNA helicase PIF1